MSSQDNAWDFQETVWEYYRGHGRDLPWRRFEPGGSIDPYKVLVSEFMLQQTQVSRVVPKFDEFIRAFPTLQHLAASAQGEVLKNWSGLGYNRRAKFLHQTAQTLIPKDRPWKYEDLVACSGIGPDTAGAILAYAYDQPVVFLETNIRTVLIYHFFRHEDKVADVELRKLAAEVLDRENPREWYWALMDYGSYLKRTVGNLSRASKSYTRQSPFQGSQRQIRGHIIRLLLLRPHSAAEINAIIADERVNTVLAALVQEGLITLKDDNYQVA
jgi:A/G-specific adenine glycosylase